MDLNSEPVTRKALMTAVISEGSLLGPPSHPDLLFNFCTKWLRERIPEASLGFQHEWAAEFVNFLCGTRLNTTTATAPSAIAFLDRSFSCSDLDFFAPIDDYDHHAEFEKLLMVAAQEAGLTPCNPGFESFCKVRLEYLIGPFRGIVWRRNWIAHFVRKMKNSSSNQITDLCSSEDAKLLSCKSFQQLLHKNMIEAWKDLTGVPWMPLINVKC